VGVVEGDDVKEEVAAKEEGEGEELLKV